MASTFTVAESYGVSPTVVDPATYINLLGANAASGSDATTAPNANPIAIPAAGSAYSFERWLRGHWVSTFTSITSVTFTRHLGALGTGVTMKAGNTGTSSYATAVNTASGVATTAITTLDTTISDATSLTAAGYSFYFVVQLIVASTAAQGTIGTMTYRFAWNEV